jgi:hypothetical protein
LAQEVAIRWGKIPEEDLKMTVYEPDTAASAVVLADIGDLKYDLNAPGQQISLSVHRRIKILKRSGFDQGDIEIPYYSKDRYQDIVQLRAQIFHPDGSKFSVERKDFFEEKTAEGYSKAKFTFPELKVGSIIEYSYVKITKSWINIPTWYFQADIPVRLSEYNLLIPAVIDFVVLVRGQALNRNEQTMETEASGFRSRKYRFAMMDAPALKKESYITTMSDYMSHVIFQISGVTDNGLHKPYLSDWPTLAKEFMEDEDFGKRIERKANFNTVYEKAAPLVAAATTPEEKMKAIYHFVIDNVKWDGTPGVYLFEPLNKVFELKKGDAAAVNLMLIALLKEFGFNVHPMLISSRDHGQPIELYPIRSQFDYVVAYVQQGDKVILLDATNPKRPLGLINEDALNRRGWVVNPLKPTWEDIKAARGTTTRMFNLMLNEEGKASGKFISAYEGYDAVDVREELAKKDDPQSNVEANNPEEKKDEEVSATLAHIEYDSVSIKNLEDIYRNLAFNAKVNIPEGATVNGDFLYINAVLHPAFEENPFKQTIREYPVDIAYPLTFRYILNLSVPQGYGIEQLPEQANLVLPNNGGRFTFLVSKPGGAQPGVQINCTFQINQVHFEPEEYSVVKKFFDLIIEKQQEQLVFKKL